MALSFTRFKDFIWTGFDGGLRRLPRAPKSMEKIAYGTLSTILNGVYYVPGVPLKKINRDFSRILTRSDPAGMHNAFVQGFIRGLKRMEMLRNGETEALDEMLEIANPARLETLVEEGKGAILVMPHCHASISMVRGLASRYPVLMLVRESKKDKRAKAQRSYYTHLGCECIDVRRTSDAAVARAVLKALKAGMFVVGVVDRIEDSPSSETPYDRERDVVRVRMFSQWVGMPAWPLRFAGRVGAPVVPCMVTQTEDRIRLTIGSGVVPTDMIPDAQNIATGLEGFLRPAPEEWLFVYDKHWAAAFERTVSRYVR